MLSEAVNRHIELYRSMGFKYKVQAYMLHSFANFAQSRSEEFIRTDSVLEWAASAPSVRQRHDRLLIVRRLACALNAEDKRHQVPPTGVFGRAQKEPSDVSHLHRGRNRPSPASCFPSDSDGIDAASYVHGFAVSYRLHRSPSFRSPETRTLRPDGRRAPHPCDKVPKEPPCSSSRKCTPRVAALSRCSQPDSDNHIHALHFPAGCRASLSDSERNLPISGALSRSARWPGARRLPHSGPSSYICSPVARTVCGRP